MLYPILCLLLGKVVSTCLKEIIIIWTKNAVTVACAELIYFTADVCRRIAFYSVGISLIISFFNASEIASAVITFCKFAEHFISWNAGAENNSPVFENSEEFFFVF